VLGVSARWPELVIVGTMLLVAAVLAVLWSATNGRATVAVHPHDVEVPRFSPARATLRVQSRRRVGVRVEDRAEPQPRAHRPVRWRGRDGTAEVEFDTSRRTVTTRGPLTAIWTDPLGITERTLAPGSTVHLVVTPRLGEVDADLRVWNPGDDWESPRSQRKSHLSEQLREYALGDEPRRIHWRSTARTGTLMVRERIGTETRDTLVFLDTDPQAWQSGGRFDVDDGAESFELGVELATSVVHQLASAGMQVAFLHGQIEHAFFVDRVSRSDFDRKMAEVTLQPVLGTAHQQLARALRSHRFKRIIIITYRPSTLLQATLEQAGRSTTVRLVTPLPPSALQHGSLPVESVRWTPAP